jgi:hypothetical protein
MATDFGTDTSCTDSLRTGRLSSGVQLVAEAAYRRLITPHGMLQGGEDEADYGLDLQDLIGSSTTKSQQAAVPGQIQAELLKDQRIESVTVDMQIFTNGPSTSYQIAIEAQTGVGPFSLVLAVSDVSVELLGLSTPVT